ncbi:hypothetical protein JCM11641_005555 [Rhodosporidiobolus odoratus]
MARRGSEDGSAEQATSRGTERRKKGVVMPREAIEHSLVSLDEDTSEYFEPEASGVIAARLGHNHFAFDTPPATDGEGRIAGGETLPKSVAAVLQMAKARVTKQWEEEWASSSVGAALRKADASPPSSSLRRVLWTLHRRHATLLTRLRTDFSHLAHSLHRAKLHSTGLCACGELETREHFILSCSLYTSQRTTLLSSLSLKHLPPLSTILSTERFILPLLSFINATDRFPRLHATVTENGGGAVKR